MQSHHFGFWYANTLKVEGDLDVSGLSFPGIPFVLIGRNDKVSWAFVQSQQRDLEDIFLVHKAKKSDIPLTSRKESIAVYRLNYTIDFEVFDSAHGIDVMPILSNAVKGAAITSNIKHVMLSSQSILKPVNLNFFHDLNKAQSVEDLHRASQNMESIALNLVFASSNGNVGYIHTGR